MEVFFLFLFLYIGICFSSPGTYEVQKNSNAISRRQAIFYSCTARQQRVINNALQHLATIAEFTADASSPQNAPEPEQGDRLEYHQRRFRYHFNTNDLGTRLHVEYRYRQIAATAGTAPGIGRTIRCGTRFAQVEFRSRPLQNYIDLYKHSTLEHID